MIRNREIFLGACLCTVLAAAFLATSKSHANGTCAEQLENAKLEMGDDAALRPHMELAEKHIAAAEAARQRGDEAKCIQEVEKAMTWIRMNPREHDGS